MSAARLVADLGRRGIRLGLTADGIRYEAPIGALTTSDRKAIGTHRAALMDLLRAANGTTAPSSPCQLCGGVLGFVEDWPSAGDKGWLCAACPARPAPTLAEVFASLSDAERTRFRGEVVAGDRLAERVAEALGETCPLGVIAAQGKKAS